MYMQLDSCVNGAYKKLATYKPLQQFSFICQNKIVYLDLFHLKLSVTHKSVCSKTAIILIEIKPTELDYTFNILVLSLEEGCLDMTYKSKFSS